MEYFGFLFFHTLFVLAVVGAEKAQLPEAVRLATLAIWIGGYLPSLALGVRRFHDLGKSGTWVLIQFVPFFGGIMMLRFMCERGQWGQNQYGPDPLAQETNEAPQKF